ncbi:cadmium resistance transporter [Halorubrum sp. DTA46]|uniref:cadmium resistance transporter n=1 Tax=Halorubrum sp. DTA46 TaxID=3402162 RepID=UPI003AAAC282
MLSIAIVATGLFVATNVDNVLVVAAFCLDEDYTASEVLAGHYAGVVVALAGAVIGAFVATATARSWVFLLGLVPIGVGAWGLVRRDPDPHGDELQVIPGTAGRIGVVTTTTIGMNGENVAVFVSFFVTLTPEQVALVVVGYLVAAGALFVIGLVMARVAGDFGPPPWVNTWFVPVVLIVVGVYVLVSGANAAGIVQLP